MPFSPQPFATPSASPTPPTSPIPLPLANKPTATPASTSHLTSLHNPARASDAIDYAMTFHFKRQVIHILAHDTYIFDGHVGFLFDDVRAFPCYTHLRLKYISTVVA